jgi:hypothetical protein
MKTGELNYLDIVKNYERSVGLDPENYFYEVREGRGRYNKIVARDYLRFSDEPTAIEKHGRAVAFIDKQTGHMFRSASWSAPAKTRLA